MDRDEVAQRWFEQEYVPVVEMLAEGGLIERGETETDAYMRVAGDATASAHARVVRRGARPPAPRERAPAPAAAPAARRRSGPSAFWDYPAGRSGSRAPYGVGAFRLRPTPQPSFRGPPQGLLDPHEPPAHAAASGAPRARPAARLRRRIREKQARTPPQHGCAAARHAGARISHIEDVDDVDARPQGRDRDLPRRRRAQGRRLGRRAGRRRLPARRGRRASLDRAPRRGGRARSTASRASRTCCTRRGTPTPAAEPRGARGDRGAQPASSRARARGGQAAAAVRVEQLDLRRRRARSSTSPPARRLALRRPGGRRPAGRRRGREVLHAGVRGQLVELVGLDLLAPRRRSRRTARSPSTRRRRPWSVNRMPAVALVGSTAASSKCSGRMPAITSRASAARPAGSTASAPAVGASPNGSLIVSPSSRAGQEVHRRRADEARHEQVRRVLVEHLRRVDLLDHPGAHDRHAVAERHRLGLVVRDVDHRRAQLLLDPRHLGAHLHAQLGVQVRQRLVHQERLRVAHDRAAHRHALALAAGQVRRLALQVLLELEDLAPPRSTLLVDLAPCRPSPA